MNREQMRHEHAEKYGRLYRALGPEVVDGFLGEKLTPDRLRRELDADEHLNGIPLSEWDAMALGPPQDTRCPTCGQRRPKENLPPYDRLRKSELWKRVCEARRAAGAKPQASLSELVCLLKYAAKQRATR